MNSYFEADPICDYYLLDYDVLTIISSTPNFINLRNNIFCYFEADPICDYYLLNYDVLKINYSTPNFINFFSTCETTFSKLIYINKYSFSVNLYINEYLK